MPSRLPLCIHFVPMRVVLATPPPLPATASDAARVLCPRVPPTPLPPTRLYPDSVSASLPPSPSPCVSSSLLRLGKIGAALLSSQVITLAPLSLRGSHRRWKCLSSPHRSSFPPHNSRRLCNLMPTTPGKTRIHAHIHTRTYKRPLKHILMFSHFLFACFSLRFSVRHVSQESLLISPRLAPAVSVVVRRQACLHAWL